MGFLNAKRNNGCSVPILKAVYDPGPIRKHSSNFRKTNSTPFDNKSLQKNMEFSIPCKNESLISSIVEITTPSLDILTEQFFEEVSTHRIKAMAV